MRSFSAYWSIVLSIVLFSTFSLPASAAMFDAAEELNITAPIGDDLYAAGGQVSVQENVAGDLVVAGGVVNVFADIDQDLTAVGGYVNVEGNIGDDVRAAAGEITIGGNVNGDLIITGGTVSVTESASISGDVIVSGGRLRLKGPVSGKLMAAGGMIDLWASVQGDVYIEGGTTLFASTIGGNTVLISDSQPTFTSDAQFSGYLRYWTRAGEIEIAEGIVSGALEYDDSLRSRPPREFPDRVHEQGKSFLSGFSFYWYFSHLLVIALLIGFANKFWKDSSKELKKRPWISALLGLMYFLLLPLAAVLFLVTLIGAPITLVLFAVFFISIYLAPIISTVVFSAYLVEKFMDKKNKWKLFGTAAAALFIYMLLGLIPWFGWLIQSVLILMGFGAFLFQKHNALQKVL